MTIGTGCGVLLRLGGSEVDSLLCSVAKSTGTIAGFDLHDELQLLVRAGFTPAEALKSATCDAAEFMGKQNDFGSVAPGKMADLVLLNANPLTDIRNTTSISAVFLMGEEFDRSALDAMLKKAEAAVTVISPPAAAPTK